MQIGILLSLTAPVPATPVEGEGGEVPAWVTALAAPSSDLPTDALVFTAGHYWSNNSEQAVTALLGDVAADPGTGGSGGAFDPTAITASGMACLLGNTNRPGMIGDLASSVYGALEQTLVFEVSLTGVDNPSTGQAGEVFELQFDGSTGDLLTVDWYGTGTDQIAWECCNTDTGSFEVAGAGTGNAVWKIACTLKADGTVVSSFNGAAIVTDVGETPVDSPATSWVGWANVASERVMGGYFLKLIRYPPQPDADLPTLSA